MNPIHLHDLPAFEPVNALAPDLYSQLDRLIQANLGRAFPALSITVAHQGEVMLNHAWGVIDPDSGALPARTDTLFDLASVTKLFSASAFLSLVSQGAVGLDDPLASVVPEFTKGGPRPVDGGQDPHTRVMLPTPDDLAGTTVDPHQVTFRHLLTHTSGLAPWRAVFREAGPVPVPPDEPEPVARDVRWARGLAALCGYPFVGQPGSTVRYSDLGLLLLGEALSRLHGTPGQVDAAIQARILNPLGLKATFNPVRSGYSRDNITPTEFDNLWRGRRCWGEVHDENACGVGGVAAHAGLFGTARDVATLGQAWLDDDPRLKIAPGIMDAARQEQAETVGERRGLGWMLKSHVGSSAGELFSPHSYGHTGFTGTSLWVEPSRGLVVACLTNRVYYGRDAEGIIAFRKALHTLLGQGWLPR